MRLCSYVVVHDTGFAPNPFQGFCTLAACTPNHQGLRFEPGDWLVGNTTKAHGNRLLHAMKVAEIMDFDDYFRDPRFEGKKPVPRGTWQDRCGDNIYHRVLDGWAQAFTYYHREPKYLEKDTRHPRVFISNHYYYFGEKAPDVPAEFGEVIQTRQGVKCSISPTVATAFIRWLEESYVTGIHGAPRDRDIRDDEVDSPLQPKPRAGGRPKC